MSQSLPANASPPADIAIQFDDRDQQRSATIFGIWGFLATEVLFFGGMVVAYVVYRHQFPETFPQASHHLNVWVGGAMTALLLLGSLLVAISDHIVEQDGDANQIRKAIFRRLLLTGALGVAFLACEFTEYYELFADGLLPGAGFDNGAFSSLAFGGRSAQIYFMLFFCMTGLHAMHTIVGVSLVLWMAIAIRWFDRPKAWANTLNVVGLYWHFVDIVWIFLYPLFYLVA